jgi:hypothetical protein
LAFKKLNQYALEDTQYLAKYISYNYIMRSLVIFTPYSILLGGKIEKNEMGVACGAYGGGERCAQGSGGET